MNKRNVFALLVAAAAVAGFALWNRTGSEDEARRGVSGQGTALSVVVPSSLSDTAKMGERAFNAVCAACHGKNAAGTDAGSLRAKASQTATETRLDPETRRLAEFLSDALRRHYDPN